MMYTVENLMWANAFTFSSALNSGKVQSFSLDLVFGLPGLFAKNVLTFFLSVNLMGLHNQWYLTACRGTHFHQHIFLIAAGGSMSLMLKNYSLNSAAAKKTRRLHWRLEKRLWILKYSAIYYFVFSSQIKHEFKTHERKFWNLFHI